MTYSDGFVTTNNLIAASLGYIADSRHLVCPSRSQGSTYLYSPTISNFAVWGGSTSGTGTRSIYSNGSGDPAVTTGAELDTGSQIGSSAWFSQSISYLPKSFGVFWLVALPSTTTYNDDNVCLFAQNTVDYKVLNVRYNASGLWVQKYDGTFLQLSAHYNSGVCEWWIEVADQGDGTSIISAYGGGQFAGSVTTTLPSGTSATAGLVQVTQSSGHTAYLSSRTFGINIGVTQLCDNMDLLWGAIQEPTPASAVNLTFYLEDVCGNITLNADFIALVQINNGAYVTVPLADRGHYWGGIIDSSKPVRIVTGSYVPSGTIQANTNIAPRCQLLNHKFGAVLAMVQQITSSY